MKIILSKVSGRESSILKNAIGSAILKMVSIIAGFLIIRVTIDYLGAEKYGLWMAISSLIAFFQLMDFGIGNALISLTSEKSSKHGIATARDILLDGFKQVSIIVFPVSLFLFIVTNYVNWQFIFKYTDPSLDVLTIQSIRAFIVSFAIGAVLSISQNVRLGLRQGHKNSFFGVFGQVLNIAFVITSIKLSLELPFLVVAATLGTIICNGANFAQLYNSLPRDNKSINRRKLSSGIMKRSGGYFLLQVIGLISFNIDNMVVAHYVSLADVATYSVAMKIFSIPSVILTLFFSGLWPAYSEAYSLKDWDWIRRTYFSSLKVGLLAAFSISIILAISINYSMQLLTNNIINASFPLILGMFFWGGLSAVTGGIASFLNGLNMIRLQVVCSFFACLINLFLSIVLSKYYGVSGPIWGSVISVVIVYPVMFVLSIAILDKKISLHL